MGPEMISLVSFLSVGIIMSVVGNFIVVGVVIYNWKSTNATYLMIASLAVSDILFGAVILPMLVHDITHSANFHEGVFACKITNALPIFCISCSAYTMVAMSIERHRAIAHIPGRPMSVSAAKKVVAAVWLSALLISLPTMMEYEVYPIGIEEANKQSNSSHESAYPEMSPPSINDGWNYVSTVDGAFADTWEKEPETTPPVVTSRAGMTSQKPSNGAHHHDHHDILECGNDGAPEWLGMANMVFVLLVVYVAPTCLTWFNYGRLINFIMSRSKRAVVQAGGATRGVSNQVTKQVTSFDRKVKIVRMLAILTGLFQLCWLPYFTILIYARTTGKDDSADNSGVFSVMLIFLGIFSVSYNAYLYVFFMPLMRAGFKRALCLGRARAAVSPNMPATTGQRMTGSTTGTHSLT